MSRRRITLGLAASGSLAVMVGLGASQQPARPTATVDRSLLDRYCVSCHNARLKTGGLTLDTLDLTRTADHAETLEKVAMIMPGA